VNGAQQEDGLERDSNTPAAPADKAAVVAVYVYGDMSLVSTVALADTAAVVHGDLAECMAERLAAAVSGYAQRPRHQRPLS